MAKKRKTLRGYKPENPVSSTRACKVTGPASMFDVRKCAEACSSHWFDKGSMSFFGSRVGSGGDPAYADGRGGAYFVSSEKRPRSNDPRRYSVRHYAGCSIDTVGEFQGYSTKAQATKAAKAAAAGGALSGRRRRK